MLMVETRAELRAELARRRAAGARVAFVPTMGALHDGHLALVDEARRRADVVVMSVFVNPLQFAPTDDFARYPRDPAGDAAKAAARGVDVLFTPDVAELGQKDAQQVAAVRVMFEDLDFRTELAVVRTAREPDGLARSSRNVYLDGDARRRAAAIPRALAAMEEAFAAEERSADALARVAESELRAGGGLTPDYVAITDPATLEPVAHAAPGTLVMVAARVGPTRLLDTIVLGDARYGTGLTGAGLAGARAG